jgi:hypothetical protein
MLVTRPGEMADALNSWPTSANWKPKLTPTDNIWADSGGSVTAYFRRLSAGGHGPLLGKEKHGHFE